MLKEKNINKNSLVFLSLILAIFVLGFLTLGQTENKNSVYMTHEDNTSVQLTENISYSEYLTICEGNEEVLATKNASRCLSYFNQSIP